ncbi:MAG: CPBP family intramembrane metalloprotease [Brevefilum sp.]|nr:CPBP family intramembrane metalloprotease [Brevefilum sp.]
MGLSKLVIGAFWNPKEQRFRAFWRLGLHTLLVILLTSAFTVGLMLLAVLLDLASGANLADIIMGASPIALVEATWVTQVIVPLAALMGVLSATFLTGRWFDHRRFERFGIRLTKAWWADFAFGLVLGAVLMGLVFLVGWLTGSLRVTGYYEVYNPDTRFFSGLVMSLVFFICVGIYEELLSRGYHLVNLAEGLNHPLLGQRGALILAFLISSLAFGLLHLGNPNATWVSTLNIAFAGVFLGLGMVLTGSLAIPIGLHITWNFFQGNVFGFPVSGIQTGATVIATEAIGPTWLTGGSFGPEAGTLGLGAMLVGSVLTVLWVRRKGKLALAEDLAVYEPRTRRLDQQTGFDTPNLDVD